MGGMKNVNRVLGPGLLFAATAIGVSHLVQSTSAGAMYGFSLLAFVIAANVLKYPFFEFGSRYASAKGKSIIDGYYDLHPIWLYTYFTVTIVSTFFVTATVGVVTIGFMEHLFHLNEFTGFSHATHTVLFGGCAALLVFGGFKLLDNVIKLLALVMVVCTLTAFVSSLFYQRTEVDTFFPALDATAWTFLIPLMGWMPTAVDLSAWNSLWTVEKIKSSGYKPTLKETLREFNLGYWLSAGLAIIFLAMGALMVFGLEKNVPTNSVEFSGFVIGLYTESIGKWSFFIISAAAFSIMFSTFIAVLDGYSRALGRTLQIGFSPRFEKGAFKKMLILLIALGSLGLILLFEQLGDFSLLVNTATSISFLIAPLIAILNLRLVHKRNIGAEFAPGKTMVVLSYVGIIFLISFSIWFLVNFLS